jgi:CheY-like chemotaxis protein
MQEAMADASVTLPREVLVVEDQKLAREALERRLKSRGYQVTSADSGSQALRVANNGRVSIVLMDSGLPGDIDGVDAAEQIQRIHPLTSFIFVSAHSHEPVYRERARNKKIRVGGWVEKPVEFPNLIRLIDRARQKLEVLASVQAIQQRGQDPSDYLRKIQDRFPASALAEALAELDIAVPKPEIHPLSGSEEAPDMKSIADEMDALYREIRDLIAQRAGEPGLKEAVRPLREKLRALQQREAEVMELHFRSRLLFDPRKGAEILERAERWLGKK